MPKLLAYGLLLAIAITAVAMIRPTSAPPANSDVQALAGPPVMDPDITALFQQVDASLLASRFNDLEEMARTFRNPEVRFPGGYPKLWYFYAALGAFRGSTCECGAFFQSNVSFEDKRSALRRWLLAMPNSMAAKIAMARLLTNQAWRVRGHAYAAATAADKMDAFEDYMAQGVTYLRGLDPRQDPAIFGGMFSAVRAEADGRKMAGQVYEAAIATFPAYFPYYMGRADLLQARWFGDDGEVAAYMAGLAKAGPGDTGLVAYSFAAEKLLSLNDSRVLFTKLGVEWSTLQRSFQLREHRFGASNTLRNAEMALAVGAADPAFAAALARQIGGRWDATVWRDAAAYAAAASWALGATPGR